MHATVWDDVTIVVVDVGIHLVITVSLIGKYFSPPWNMPKLKLSHHIKTSLYLTFTYKTVDVRYAQPDEAEAAEMLVIGKS